MNKIIKTLIPFILFLMAFLIAFFAGRSLKISDSPETSAAESSLSSYNESISPRNEVSRSSSAEEKSGSEKTDSEESGSIKKETGSDDKPAQEFPEL